MEIGDPKQPVIVEPIEDPFRRHTPAEPTPATLPAPSTPEPSKLPVPVPA